MKVIVNYPDTEEGIKMFNEQFALFNAKLLLEKIKALDASADKKKEILKETIHTIKENDPKCKND